MADTMSSASARTIEAMGLALGRADVGDALPFLESLAATDLSGTRRQELLRRLMSAARLSALNCRAAHLLQLDATRLPLPFAEFWPFAEAEMLVQALTVGEGPTATTRTQVPLRTEAGTLHVRLTCWREPDGAPGDLSFGLEDVSGQVAAEADLVTVRAQMAHADRLSTLGVMTATITHEVRQPVAAMMTSAQAALRWLGRSPPDLEQVTLCLDTIVAGATKVEETVAWLRQMASSRAGSRERCDVKGLIEETAAFLRQELANRQATLVLDVPEDLPRVLADCVQIRQVLTNLMINAAQAMADAQCWSRSLKVRARSSGTAVVVDVDDSGPGIGEAARQRLFDGFFTTKNTGLGLGLKICRQIVQDHGGTLENAAKTGAGSIFRFTLPTAG